MRKFFKSKLIASLAVFIGLSTLAYALTTPPTVATRRVPQQTTTHYRFTMNFNDGNIGSGIKFGAMPAKAFITNVDCQVLVVFNAATTNYMGIGTTQAVTAGGAGDIVNGPSATTAACQLATLGYQPLSTVVGLGMAVTSPATPTGTSGGWDMWVRYSQTGTAATTGQVVVIIEYVPDDDQ